MESEVLTYNNYEFLKKIGIEEENEGCFDGKQWMSSGNWRVATSPHNNKGIARIKMGTNDDYERCIKNMDEIKEAWMGTSMVLRGQIVQEIGVRMKALKDDFGSMVSLEMGKVLNEGKGEIQEFIDICEYAVGLARTLSGKIYPSERFQHELLEKWNPLGHIGVISAFNFPAAVLGWNAAIALVCGDLVIWKGALTTSLVTISVTKLIGEVLKEYGFEGVFTSIAGEGKTVGETIINDARLKLISFTGSTGIGKRVSTAVHTNFGRTILELGGNNAIVVMEDADVDMALKAVVFSAVGTCGQRCTSLRRLIVHESIYDKFVERLVKVYSTIKIGSPFESDTLCGPLHTKQAVSIYENGIKDILKQVN